MEKLNKILIILLIIILVAIFGIGGYTIYRLNDKIEQQSNELLNFKKNNTENKLIIENNIVADSGIDNVISNQLAN